MIKMAAMTTITATADATPINIFLRLLSLSFVDSIPIYKHDIYVMTVLSFMLYYEVGT